MKIKSIIAIVLAVVAVTVGFFVFKKVNFKQQKKWFNDALGIGA